MSEHGGPPSRLIEVNSLELVTVRSPDPQYAILSHTWGNDEVTFKDWRTSGWKEMKGFAKILGACKQAKTDGFRYLWVDTCCIDKSSSAELAKAINSMYNWYRESEVCYAYLRDVSMPKRDRRVNYMNFEHAMKQFRESRWFTRGWTLQELLAPEKVIFFDSEWTCIGPLDNLLDPVAEITGIDRSALNHTRPLEAFSTAQKFCWASNRSTHELEDEAYCLLGLCRISLHPNYGEGRKAFLRLQEEVFRQGDDSVFVWDSSGSNRHSRLFASAPSDFADSGDVECDESRPIDSDMWLTNRGVAGRFCLLPRGTAPNPWLSAVALLSCRQAGNVHKLLALLIQNDSKNGSSTMYSVQPRAAQRPKPSRWKGSLRSARLVSISESSLPLAEKRQITLAREPPAVDFPTVSGGLASPCGTKMHKFYNPRLEASRDPITQTEYRNYIEVSAGENSRPSTHDEAQTLYRLESHVRRCNICTDGCKQIWERRCAYLCRTGKTLFRDVSKCFQIIGGRIYPKESVDDTYLEIANEYWAVRSLLAISA
jgi:hypothetical protein